MAHILSGTVSHTLLLGHILCHTWSLYHRVSLLWSMAGSEKNWIKFLLIWIQSKSYSHYQSLSEDAPVRFHVNIIKPCLVDTASLVGVVSSLLQIDHFFRKLSWVRVLLVYDLARNAMFGQNDVKHIEFRCRNVIRSTPLMSSQAIKSLREKFFSTILS